MKWKGDVLPLEEGAAKWQLTVILDDLAVGLRVPKGRGYRVSKRGGVKLNSVRHLTPVAK